jgi:hypothetical protein
MQAVARRLLMAVAALLFCARPGTAETPLFHNVTHSAGIAHVHGYIEERIGTHHMFLAGVAASDYDNDGFVDLYVIRGSIGPNLLYRNRGDGTFEDVAAAAHVAVNGDMASGPLFFDANGDGMLDLFVGGTQGTPNHLFIANGDGTFTDRIPQSRIPQLMETFSATAADYDRDGDLDLFLAHWEIPMQASHLWRNDGHGVFWCVDDAAGIHNIGDGTYDYSFTANFTDLNNDRWPDIVMAGDFKTSRVFMNGHDGTFRDATSPIITDENGMGAAVGDYDNDGDLDWFVSSIYDATQVPNGGAWGFTGNRMYRNRGDGSFDDATDATGVRQGGWGWGSSFADFNNDGWLDLYQVNGWPFEVDTFLEDPARLFMNDCHGGFVESSEAAGCASTAQGRGVVCFDYDNDGDVDIFISNYRGAPELLRNDSVSNHSWLTLSLRGPHGAAISARASIEASGITQTREVMCGNNYLSQNPTDIHVGLGSATSADRIRVQWPNGQTSTLLAVSAGQRFVLDQPSRSTPAPQTLRIVNVSPNPFRDTATITLEGAPASAAIYDVAGRLVRRLSPRTGVNEWNGLDNAGARAPAGVYWIRVGDGTRTATTRVVLVR